MRWKTGNNVGQYGAETETQSRAIVVTAGKF